ncbi:MAG TPA: YebC/PmpR family DNA-binding transcriptional regulator [Nannocystaceae bacterium]|nr:YebC/PmpR family DNA-binding transcriptional regulator [Nannocystaceae bacterium]
MSGHSKWSTIKRKKGALDAKRGKIFTKIARDIMTAVRQGGGDPGGNPSLRLALASARAANMPKDNQERAIRKGLGELEGAEIEEAVYEGRGPKGTAWVIDTLTDNRNRTVAELRKLFSRNGGELGASGSVMWMFDYTGVVTIPKTAIEEDALTERVLELGGNDVKDGGDDWIVLCDSRDFIALQTGLEDLAPTHAERQYLAKADSLLAVTGDDAIACAQFLAKVDEIEDVQNVFTNAELPDDVLQEHGP